MKSAGIVIIASLSLMFCGCVTSKQTESTPKSVPSVDSKAKLKAWVETEKTGTVRLHWTPEPSDENSLLFYFVKSPTPISPDQAVKGDLSVMIVPAHSPWALDKLPAGYYSGKITGFMRNDLESNWFVFQIRGTQ